MMWLTTRSNQAPRRRSRPTLEALEGRRLLASATVATTPDANGNAVLVAVQPSGTVVVNQKRPTNDASNPYQYTGYQTLPGLTAATVTAATLPNGDPVIYAKPQALSYLFANEYLATGDPANPFAWSGWQRVGGDFVNTSVTAATSGGTSAVFAIGADAQVYAATVVPATTPGTPATLGAFQKLPAFGAYQIAVQADGDGRFEVAATAGPRTYVYGNRVTLAGDAAPTSTGWQQLGNFVAKSIDLSPGLNTSPFGVSLGDRVFLYTVGADNNVYYNPLIPNATTGNRDSTTYTVIGGGDAVSSKASVSQGYLTVYVLDSRGFAFSYQLVATGLLDTPISLFDPYGAILNSPYIGLPNRPVITALAVAPQTDGGFDLLVSSTDGSTQVDTQFPHPALRFSGSFGYSAVQNSYGGFADLAGRVAHPIAASDGPGGGNVVVSLGSDGQVYASTAPAATTAAPTPVFSAFAALPGLTATSIVAAQLNDSEVAVYALTGSSSLVYENQYLATGDEATPFAWTGWRPLGPVEAKAIAAAHVAGTDQASVFAIDADGLVTAIDRSADPEAPTEVTARSLNGLIAASIAVRGYDSSRIEVIAINAPVGYGFTRFYQPSGVETADPSGPPIDQWFFTGTYFLKQAAGGRNGKYVVGVGPSGVQAASRSYQATNSTVGTNYVPLNFNQNAVYNVTYNGYRSAGLVSINSATSDASIQLVVPGVQFNYSNDPAQIFIVTGGGTTASTAVTSPTVPTGVLLRTLGASTAAVENEYYIGDTLGRIYVSRFSTASGATAPTFTDYALVGTLPT